jgi:hypothetical protein
LAELEWKRMNPGVKAWLKAAEDKGKTQGVSAWW